MVGQQDKDVRSFEDLFKGCEWPLGKAVGRDERFADKNLPEISLKKFANDLQARAFSEVVDVRFVSEAQTANDWLRKLGGSGDDLFHDHMRLVVVHVTGGLHQGRNLGVRVNEKPGIHADAVASDPGPRAKDLDPWMLVGQLDDFKDIGT